MKPQQFVAVIDAIRAGCLAQVALAELVLEKVPDEFKPLIGGLVSGAASTEVLSAIAIEEIRKNITTGNHESREPAPCEHPEDERIPMRAMGHPHRFKCNVCNTIVD